MGAERRPDFDEWFFALYPDALALARRVVGDSVEGEDIATEAFTRALARWDHVRSLGYRDAWLLRVTVNVGIDALRRHRVNVGLAEGVVRPDDVERRIVVVAALKKLSRRQRQAVALRYLGQFSEGEAAEVMGLSPGTIKTHLRRGLARLRADPSLITEESGDDFLTE